MSGTVSSTDRQGAHKRADDHYPRPRRGDSAKSVLVTMLGELVLPGGGAAWTGTMVDGLGHLGFSERNARHRLEHSFELLREWTPLGMTADVRRRPVPDGAIDSPDRRAGP